MNKRKIAILVAILISAITTSFAQSAKYGHVDSQAIMRDMPNADSIQIKLMDFQNELQTVYETTLNEYQSKKDAFDREAGTMSSSIRKVKENEILALETSIYEFQNSVELDLQEKQIELITPFQQQLEKAIDQVAQENGYQYIFDTQILLYADTNNDVTALVKKKLGIVK